eukprot:6205218-Pleurochrysis_carterae.AAC.3
MPKRPARCNGSRSEAAAGSGSPHSRPSAHDAASYSPMTVPCGTSRTNAAWHAAGLPEGFTFAVQRRAVHWKRAEQIEPIRIDDKTGLRRREKEGQTPIREARRDAVGPDATRRVGRARHPRLRLRVVVAACKEIKLVGEHSRLG